MTENAEKPVGEWNTLSIECVKNTIKIYVNEQLMNYRNACSTIKGQIAIQAKGSVVKFRKVEITR